MTWPTTPSRSTPLAKATPRQNGSGRFLRIRPSATSSRSGAAPGSDLMIEHDLANHTLKIYSAGQGDAAAKWQWTVFTDPAVCDQFKVGRSARIRSDDRT